MQTKQKGESKLNTFGLRKLTPETSYLVVYNNTILLLQAEKWSHFEFWKHLRLIEIAKGQRLFNLPEYIGYIFKKDSFIYTIKNSYIATIRIDDIMINYRCGPMAQ